MQLPIIVDQNTPVYTSAPYTTQFLSLQIMFTLPSSSTFGLGPESWGSGGLFYGQWIGVSFSSEITLGTPSASSYTCTLTDSNKVTYTLNSPIVTNNIVYCQMADPNKSLTSNLQYTLTIKFSSTVSFPSNISNIGIFTSSSADANQVIFDANYNIGPLVAYKDFTQDTTSKYISFSSSTVTNSAASPCANKICYGQTFGITFSLTTTTGTFLPMNDYLFVFQYPSTFITPPSTIAGVANTSPVTTAPNGGSNFSIRPFMTGTNSLIAPKQRVSSFYIGGWAQDWAPSTTYYFTTTGWGVANPNGLDTTNNKLEFMLLYQNTNTIFAYDSAVIFSITQPALTLTASHPEFWDIYQGGAWPISFSYTINYTITSTLYIVITQSAVSATNRLSFIPSTCDLPASFGTTFSTRPACYAYDKTQIASGGSTSGFFFKSQSVTTGTTYTVNVWAFADACATTSTNIYSNITGAKFIPQFTISIYSSVSLSPSNLDFNRFIAGYQYVSFTTTTNALICWNTYTADNTATLAATLTYKNTDYPTGTTTVAAALAVNANTMYYEVYDFSSAVTPPLITNSAYTSNYAGATSPLATAWIYPSTGSIAGSYFYISWTIPSSSNQAALVAPAPVYNKSSTLTDISNATLGYVVYQLPNQWYYSPTSSSNSSPSVTISSCIASWAVSSAATVTQQLLNGTSPLVAATTGLNPTPASNFNSFYYSTPTINSVSNLNTGVPAPLTSGKAMKIASPIATSTPNTYTFLNDYTATLSSQSLTTAFFSNCAILTIPSVTSLYTYIDIQIQYWIPTSTASVYAPYNNTRFIKLYPEGGLFYQTSPKVTNNSNASTIMKNHVAYGTSTHSGVCLFEILGTINSYVTSSQGSVSTLILWFSFGVFLESDWTNVGSDYPVGGLTSGSIAYGLQSPYPMSPDNAYVSSTLIPKFGPMQFMTTPVASKSTYLHYFGSTLYIPTTGTLTGSSTTSFFVPYYCPWITAISTAATYLQTGPTVAGAFFQSNTFTSFGTTGSHDIVILVSTTANMIIQATLNKLNSTSSGVSNFFYGSVKFADITTTPNNNNLYFWNGDVTSTLNDASVTCTGFSVLLNNMFTITGTPYVNSSGNPLSTATTSKTFSVNGVFFSKAILGAASQITIAPTTSNVTTANSLPSTYINGITTPSITSFLQGTTLVTKNLLYFGCADATLATSTSVSNFLTNDYNIGTSTAPLLLLDYAIISGTTFNNPNFGVDSPMIGLDNAGNIQFTLAPSNSVSFPPATTISFGFSGNGAIAICLANYGSTLVACSGTPTLSCPLGNTSSVSSVKFCCYNLSVPNSGIITLQNIVVSLNWGGDTSDRYSGNLLWNPIPAPTLYTYSTADKTYDNTKNSSLTSTYSIVNQAGGYGKVQFTVTIGRNMTYGSQLKISATISGFLIPNFPPRCYATFSSSNVSYVTSQTDGVIDSCNVNLTSGTAITINTKNIVYQCGSGYASTIYVSLWPVSQIQWLSTDTTNAWTVALSVGGSQINTSTVTSTLSFNGNTTAPGTNAALCTVNSIYPPVAGEWADYNFAFDLQTSTTLLNTTPANEFNIFFSYSLYHSFASVLCYSGTNLSSIPAQRIECSWIDEGVLSVRFSSNTVGNTLIRYVKVSGLKNPSTTSDINFACSINTTTFNGTSASNRKNIVVGQGKYAGGFPVPTKSGTLRFYSYFDSVTNTVASNIVPRETTNLTIRVALNNALHQEGLPSSAISNGAFFITFPSQYNLQGNATPTVTVTEYIVGSTNTITSNATTNPITLTTDANNVYSNNRFGITFSTTATQTYTMNTNFIYWEIDMTNVPNPRNSGLTDGFSITFVSLPSSGVTIPLVYRTPINSYNFLGSALSTVAPPLLYNRGLTLTFNLAKWVLDIYTDATSLNNIRLKAGRYTIHTVAVRSNSNTSINAGQTTVSLSSGGIASMLQTSLTVNTATNGVVTFWLGTTCSTIPGYYMITFSQSDTTAFEVPAMIMLSVDSTTIGTVSIQAGTTLTTAANTELPVYIVTDDITFDPLTITFTTATTNAATTTITPSVTIASGTNSVKAMFAYPSTTTSTTQSFTIGSINACFAWSTAQSPLTFTISGANTSTVSTLAASQFTYLYYDTLNSLPRNSIQITFTPTSSQIPATLYCAISCTTLTIPDGDILQGWKSNNSTIPNINNTALLQFYNAYITSSQPYVWVYNNLARGMTYNHRCVLSSNAVTPVNSASVGITVNTTAAAPTVSIIFAFTSPIINDWISAALRYCQNKFSANGRNLGGVVVGIFNNSVIQNISVGLTAPTPLACPVTSRNRLRFLKERELDTSTGTSGSTATTTLYYMNVAAMSNPVSANDGSASTVMSQVLTDLKQSSNWNTLAGATTTVPVSSTYSVLSSDTTAPASNNIQSTVQSSSPSFTVTATTPVIIYFKIIQGTNYDTCSAIEACTDTTKCGTLSVTSATATFTLSASTSTGLAYSTPYNIEYCQTNNIPNAIMTSTVGSLGTFTTGAAPTNNTNTTGNASILSINLLAFFFIILMLI